MTSKEHSIIMRYFNDKKVSREELEKLLNFQNLTMESNTAHEISKLLKNSSDTKANSQAIIKDFVRLVRDRNGSGELTWDELILSRA